MKTSRNIDYITEKLTPYQLSQALDIPLNDAEAIISGIIELNDVDNETKEKLIELNNKLLN